MKIGLDLTVLQTPHRLRGIGATAINFVNNLDQESRQNNSFVFFLNKADGDVQEILDLLDLTDMDVEVRGVHEASKITLPGRLHIFGRLLNGITTIYRLHAGDPRISDTHDLDSLLQFDQSQSLPKRRTGLTRAVILYDLIQIILEADYLSGYKSSRRKGHSRKGSLLASASRWRYIHQVKTVAKKADKLFAISEQTKHDYVKYLGIKPEHIQVVYLGVDTRKAALPKENPAFNHYTDNNWGYFPEPVTLTKRPFILFVGGADARRKLGHVVTAFNHLRACGNQLDLVLAGDIMQGPKNIPDSSLRKQLEESSYRNDIQFLGFVSDTQREWLYDKALCFVYPSMYEGFGLPVLEAMQHGTPVITYANSSLKEIGGDAALYATGALDIADKISLLKDSELTKEYSDKGRQQAAKFTWDKTAKTIVKQLIH